MDFPTFFIYNEIARFDVETGQNTTDTREETIMKWYQKTGWIIVFLFLFFPVGCYLMWKYKSGWSKWLKWPVTLFFGLCFFSAVSASLFPAPGPDSLTLTNAGETSMNTGESVTLLLEASPSDASLSGLSFIYDASLIDVRKGTQENEIIVSAKNTPGTAGVCVKTSGGEAFSNIVVLEIQDPQAAETAQAEQEAELQDAVAAALSESQALLTEKEQELNETVALLEETQQDLEQTQKKLEETEAELAEAANARRSASAGSTQTADPSADNSSSVSADTGITNSQTVLVTRTGSKYHTHKCGNGTYYEATLDEALARGLTPCEKCY